MSQEEALLARISMLNKTISMNQQQKKNRQLRHRHQRALVQRHRKRPRVHKGKPFRNSSAVFGGDGSAYKVTTGKGSKSIRRVVPARAKRSKSGVSKRDTLCTYYVKTGTCMRGASCAYLHDPASVAVCRKFLRGACIADPCPLSHVKDQQKMPMCRFFLFGTCAKSAAECPYSHVYVNPNAQVCPEFVSGVCAKGVNCLLQHTLDCPSFRKYGWCESGKKCKLRHIEKYREYEISEGSEDEDEEDEDDDDEEDEGAEYNEDGDDDDDDDKEAEFAVEEDVDEDVNIFPKIIATEAERTADVDSDDLFLPNIVSRSTT